MENLRPCGGVSGCGDETGASDTDAPDTLFVRERRTEASFELCLRNFEGRSPRSGELGGDGGSFTNTLGGCRSKGVRSSQSMASGFSGGLLRPRFISSMDKDASVTDRNTRANAETMLLLAWTEFVVLIIWGLKFRFLWSSLRRRKCEQRREGANHHRT